MRIYTKIVAAILMFGLVPFAEALPQFMQLFRAHYNIAANSHLFDMKCTVCHIANGNPNHNPYGKELKVLVEASPHKLLTAAMLKDVEKSDSDHDGYSNIDEVLAGTSPGDPKSFPSPIMAANDGSPDTTRRTLLDLVPTHSFHPLIVHFPIALFLFGVFLEILGRWKQMPDLRKFAIWNLGFGAIASVGAVATGLTAFLRLGFPLEGNVLTHLILGSSSAILMCVVAYWRRLGIYDHKFYWFILLLTAAVVAATGHIGASIVYG